MTDQELINAAVQQILAGGTEIGGVQSTTSPASALVIDANGQLCKTDLANLSLAEMSQIAFGFYAKETSNQSWGIVGNQSLFKAFESRCGNYLVTFDGRAAKLDKNDRTRYADGTTLDTTKGNIMCIMPRLYYRYDTGNGIVWLSEMPISDKYIGGAGNGSYNCIGTYMASTDGSSRLRSLSGASSTNSITINTFWSRAQNNGAYWGITDYDQWKLLQMLGLAKYGNPNIQAMLGYGLCGNGDTWSVVNGLSTGATDSLGDSSGTVPGATDSNSLSTHVSFMGIENLWGWRWQFIQGIFCGSSNNSGYTGSEVFIYDGNRMPSSSELASHPVAPYRTISRNTSSGGSYITTMYKGEYFDMIPTAVGGSDATYYGDGFWANTTGQVCLFGGSADNGARCGLSCCGSDDAFSVAFDDCGGRLAYYGPLTFVNGGEI